MPKLTPSFQSSQFSPRKRARHASDTTFEPDSAQQSIMEMALGQQSNQESEYEYGYEDTTMINAETATPDITINQRHLSSLSPEEEEEEEEEVDYDDDDGDDDGLEISDLPSSFPTSQLTTQSSSSPTVRFQAIKQAMQEKFLNREISFHLPSSSFVDETFLKHLDAVDPGQGERKGKEQIQSSNPSPTNMSEGASHRAGSDDGGDDESDISLSESEFDSQITIPSAIPGQQFQRPEESISLIDPSDYHEIVLEEERLHIPRRHARIAAYRAARKGTYEAWSTACPLLSVGDNHTEREIEL